MLIDVSHIVVLILGFYQIGIKLRDYLKIYQDLFQVLLIKDV